MVFSFFLSRGSQKAPDHPQTRKSRFLIGKSTILQMHVLLSSVIIDETGKISKNRPEMATLVGKIPRVDRRLTERHLLVATSASRAPRRTQPLVDRRVLRYSTQPLITNSSKGSFFSGGRKVLALFFRPDRGDCRSRKMLQTASFLAM